MATTPADFIVKFPEFAAVDTGRIQLWMDFVTCIICVSSFLSCAQDWAVYLLTAHYLKLDIDRQNGDIEEQGDSAAGVASMGVGDVNISFNTGQVTEYYKGVTEDAISRELASTNYGRIYLSLRRRTGRVAATTGMVRFNGQNSYQC